MVLYINMNAMVTTRHRCHGAAAEGRIGSHGFTWKINSVEAFPSIACFCELAKTVMEEVSGEPRMIDSLVSFAIRQTTDGFR